MIEAIIAIGAGLVLKKLLDGPSRAARIRAIQTSRDRDVAIERTITANPNSPEAKRLRAYIDCRPAYRRGMSIDEMVLTGHLPPDYRR